MPEVGGYELKRPLSGSRGLVRGWLASGPGGEVFVRAADEHAAMAAAFAGDLERAREEMKSEAALAASLASRTDRVLAPLEVRADAELPYVVYPLAEAFRTRVLGDTIGPALAAVAEGVGGFIDDTGRPHGDVRRANVLFRGDRAVLADALETPGTEDDDRAGFASILTSTVLGLEDEETANGLWERPDRWKKARPGSAAFREIAAGVASGELGWGAAAARLRAVNESRSNPTLPIAIAASVLVLLGVTGGLLLRGGSPERPEIVFVSEELTPDAWRRLCVWHRRLGQLPQRAASSPFFAEELALVHEQRPWPSYGSRSYAQIVAVEQAELGVVGESKWFEMQRARAALQQAVRAWEPFADAVALRAALAELGYTPASGADDLVVAIGALERLLLLGDGVDEAGATIEDAATVPIGDANEVLGWFGSIESGGSGLRTRLESAVVSLGSSRAGVAEVVAGAEPAVGVEAVGGWIDAGLSVQMARASSAEVAVAVVERGAEDAALIAEALRRDTFSRAALAENASWVSLVAELAGDRSAGLLRGLAVLLERDAASLFFEPDADGTIPSDPRAAGAGWNVEASALASEIERKLGRAEGEVSARRRGELAAASGEFAEVRARLGAFLAEDTAWTPARVAPVRERAASLRSELRSLDSRVLALLFTEDQLRTLIAEERGRSWGLEGVGAAYRGLLGSIEGGAVGGGTSAAERRDLIEDARGWLVELERALARRPVGLPGSFEAGEVAAALDTAAAGLAGELARETLDGGAVRAERFDRLLAGVDGVFESARELESIVESAERPEMDTLRGRVSGLTAALERLGGGSAGDPGAVLGDQSSGVLIDAGRIEAALLADVRSELVLADRITPALAATLAARLGEREGWRRPSSSEVEAALAVEAGLLDRVASSESGRALEGAIGRARRLGGVLGLEAVSADGRLLLDVIDRIGAGASPWAEALVDPDVLEREAASTPRLELAVALSEVRRLGGLYQRGDGPEDFGGFEGAIARMERAARSAEAEGLGAAASEAREVLSGAKDAGRPLDEIGPARAGWRMSASAPDESWVEYSSPRSWAGDPTTLRFVRVESAPDWPLRAERLEGGYRLDETGRGSIDLLARLGESGDVYLLDSEVSIGLAGAAYETGGIARAMIGRVPIDIADPTDDEGLRLWSEQADQILAGRAVLQGFFDNPERAYVARAPGDPAPGPEHPMQRVRPHEALAIAVSLGCRLPTVWEFLAAVREFGDASPNLGDRVLAETQQQIAALRPPGQLDSRAWSGSWAAFDPRVTGVVGGDRLPDPGLFGREADGTIYFRPVRRGGPGDLIGNVAEWVSAWDVALIEERFSEFDVGAGRRDGASLVALLTPGLMEGLGFREIRPNFGRSRFGYGELLLVAGGSGLMPLGGDGSELVRAAAHAYAPSVVAGRGGGEGDVPFSDVGFRLAFSSSGSGPRVAGRELVRAIDAAELRLAFGVGASPDGG